MTTEINTLAKRKPLDARGHGEGRIHDKV